MCIVHKMTQVFLFIVKLNNIVTSRALGMGQLPNYLNYTHTHTHADSYIVLSTVDQMTLLSFHGLILRLSGMFQY